VIAERRESDSASRSPATAAKAPDGAPRLIITVPHASNALPHWIDMTGETSRWNDLSTQHWAFDRGAAPLAQAIAGTLDVSVVQGDVSRLVIDLNRDLADQSIIPREVPGVGVLDFNASISSPDLSARWLAHACFHAKIEDELSAAALTAQSVFLIDLHTFDRFGPTKSYREVDIGICSPALSDFCYALLDILCARTHHRPAHEQVDVAAGVVNICLDDPYSADHPGAYVTRRHTGPNVHGVVIEVCDELLAIPDNIGAVAYLLCSAIQAAILRVDQANGH
jgi:predicted N-formylglutamate amidohydrolase